MSFGMSRRRKGLLHRLFTSHDVDALAEAQQRHEAVQGLRHVLHDESDGFQEIVGENGQHVQAVPLHKHIERPQLLPQRRQRMVVVNLGRYDSALKDCFGHCSAAAWLPRSLGEGGASRTP